MTLMIEEMDALQLAAAPPAARAAGASQEGEATRLRLLARDLRAEARLAARRSAD